jgi:hypothetical protein
MTTDMLLAPGPAAEEVGPGPLAAGLLQRLKDMGFVPEVRHQAGIWLGCSSTTACAL